MKMMIVVALALVAAVAAAPQGSPVSASASASVGASASGATEPPKILRSAFEQQPEGGYGFSYETENGITRTETGEVKQVLDEENKPHDVVVVRGQYSYTDDTGKVQTISYIADETGFHAEGEAVPKASR